MITLKAKPDKGIQENEITDQNLSRIQTKKSLKIVSKPNPEIDMMQNISHGYPKNARLC